MRLTVLLLSCAVWALPLGAQSRSSQTPQSGATAAKTESRNPATASARARRAREARARAAARARELRELAEPKFRVGADGSLIPDVRAEAAIIYNPVTGEVLWEENAQDQRSIASITKVMTAVVFMEDQPDLTRRVLVTRDDVRGASTTYIRRNETLTVDDLLHLLLIGSDNAAARVLARVSPWGSVGFIDRMNEKAIELGMENTRFADPSGLNDGNVSSAYDLSRLITYAVGNEQIAPIMQKAAHTIRTNRRQVKVQNTNKLLGSGLEVRGGKTGFIRKAGYCLATLLQLPHGPQVAVVVLGARSSVGRFTETRHLFNWLSGKAQELLFQDQQPQQ